MTRNLLMIPGPIEISPSVQSAAGKPPLSHTDPQLIAAFGHALELMRKVWCADSDAQPFIVAGSGTLAMEMAVANLVDGGDEVCVVNTGYFSDRIAEMLRRRGAQVRSLSCKPGSEVALEVIEAALDERPCRALFATHVDTSTAVRIDAEGIAKLCRARGVLSVFDGVCATAGEEFRMAEWGADLYLTASQKAIGLPPGLALLVASPAALERRRQLKLAPPLGLDFESWIPIMRAYEAGQPSYFATPATTFIPALEQGLTEILSEEGDMHAAVNRHRQKAEWMRSCWEALGLELLPRKGLASNLLSALYYPQGVDASLVAAVAKRGVSIAGGLHPKLKTKYFRVGHMGYVLNCQEDLKRCVVAIAEALKECGHPCDPHSLPN